MSRLFIFCNNFILLYWNYFYNIHVYMLISHIFIKCTHIWERDSKLETEVFQLWYSLNNHGITNKEMKVKNWQIDQSGHVKWRMIWQNGGKLRSMLFGLIRRLNLFCIAGNTQMQFGHNMLSCINLLKHRASFQDFFRYVNWHSEIRIFCCGLVSAFLQNG